jgi:ABC-type amino acid transport substrate-binding protein
MWCEISTEQSECLPPFVPRVFRLILTFATLFFSTQVQAILYRTCAQDFFPKFYMENHEMHGYSVDIMNAIHRLNKQLNFEDYQDFCTIPRIETEMLFGRKDIFVAAFKTSERQEKFNFLDEPLCVLKYVMVVRKSDPVMVSSFNDIRSLGEDRIILTLLGTALQSFLERQSDLQINASASSVDANLRMLQYGRGRFFFTVDLGLEGRLNTPPWQGKFRILPAVFGEESQFIMVSKKLDPKNVKPLANALKRLRSSGELDKICQFYRNKFSDTSPINSRSKK